MACAYVVELDGLVDVVKRVGGNLLGFHDMIEVDKSSVLRALANRMRWGCVQRDEIERKM